MGWNDHDDRLMMISETLEDEGVEYPLSYEIALDIRQEEIRTGEIESLDYIFAIAEDVQNGEWVRGMPL